MTSDFDILFLAGLFPKEKEREIINNSKGGIQNAANNLQWEIALGLEENSEKPITILNSLYIGSYPLRYKKFLIKTHRFSHLGQSNNDINVGFTNLPFIKNFSRYNTMKKHLKDWVMNKSGNKKVVIAYAMTAPYTSLLKYAKEMDNEIITCLIVPDLPQYMNLSGKANPLYNVLKKIEISKIENDMKSIDCYVFLTKYMQDFLKITVPTTIIEGISTNVFTDIRSDLCESEIKTILYSGGLFEKYGIMDLVESFKRIENSDYRLVICGSGEAEAEILAASENDNRIIYKGLLSRQEVLELQKNSTILVNPRPNNEDYTKYSFPSKIMEYMSSGRPVLAYYLDGMPNEYRKYIYTIDEENDGFYKALKDVISKPSFELTQKGLAAKEFVLKHKNKKEQTAKIMHMLKEF